ncbi:hypothetical protein, partial [Microbacterium sp.]|uniref:hypothetical protein n=1 Tax=Microbacterium sp. TaxID=51671 RepID=UPI0028128B8F
MDTSAPPVLQMLWEPNDPAEVMRRRFGFGSEAAAAGWVGALLRSHWGREVTACERIVMSDMNALAWVRVGSTRMIAKWSPVTERFARLDALAELNA